jgi:hypothetical protein
MSDWVDWHLSWQESTKVSARHQQSQSSRWAENLEDDVGLQSCGVKLMQSSADSPVLFS